MPLPRLADLSSDLLDDFRLDAAEQFPRCEQLLIELERAPSSGERLRELFRLVHTLKGNLGYVGLNALMPLPQAMEDVLGTLREERLAFDSLLGDILLLTLDHLRALIDQALGGPNARLGAAQLDQLCQALQALAMAPASQQGGNPPPAAAATGPQHPPASPARAAAEPDRRPAGPPRHRRTP
ncbi:Hpt domain-containing protein [Pseudomonas sp. NPDC077649]|jgi:chemotaxis protein histidine kinase CheA|uniref:Hpt domain-containing protein n=1 Tax=Pseudomonas sp. NPDC077649 TaxID=3364423 RepID=UPI0037C76E62